MTEPIPFRAFRPIRGKAELMVSRPYIAYSQAELNEKLSQNPYSFVQVMRPEFSDDPGTLTTEVFNKVKQKFGEFVRKGWFVQDDSPCFYLYQQVAVDASYTGLICGVPTEAYRDGRIKIHEQTIKARVDKIRNHLYHTGFNAEPVLLTYREHLADLQNLFSTKIPEKPEYDFTTSDGIAHRLWKIADREDISRIKSLLSRAKTLYIADGHHRMQSSARMAEMRRRENPHHTGREPYNYTMAMIMSGENLRILPFHRLLKTGFEVDDETLLRRLATHFDIIPDDGDVLPPYPRTYGLRLKKGWYSLRLKMEITGGQAVDRLDASILNNLILNPIFGITEHNRSARVEYIADNRDLTVFEEAIQNGTYKALFTLHKIAAEHLFEVAEAGETMPPKTTYIEPKMRSGLTVMSLE